MPTGQDGIHGPAGTLFTVNGTGDSDPFGPGLAGDVARALADAADGLWVWQPIGYPAATFPMSPSVQAGRAELRAQIDRCQGRIALSGHSQGAMVVDLVWRDDVLDPAGALHHRIDDIVAIVNFGDPMRCPGIANGNAFAGQPLPHTLDGGVTGGIAGPGDLTAEQTPEHLLVFADDGDLYASAPTGLNPWLRETEIGHDERIIFDIVQDASAGAVLAIAARVGEVLDKTLQQVLPLVQAITNGPLFTGEAAQPPRRRYDIDPAVRYLTELGQRLRTSRHEHSIC